MKDIYILIFLILIQLSNTLQAIEKTTLEKFLEKSFQEKNLDIFKSLIESTYEMEENRERFDIEIKLYQFAIRCCKKSEKIHVFGSMSSFLYHHTQKEIEAKLPKNYKKILEKLYPFKKGRLQNRDHNLLKRSIYIEKQSINSKQAYLSDYFHDICQMRYALILQAKGNANLLIGSEREEALQILKDNTWEPISAKEDRKRGKEYLVFLEKEAIRSVIEKAWKEEKKNKKPKHPKKPKKDKGKKKGHDKNKKGDKKSKK